MSENAEGENWNARAKNTLKMKIRDLMKGPLIWWHEAMEAIVSLVALMGMGFAAFAGIKWMLKNGQLSPNKEQPLTPNDLKVLEESAARLMADLRAVTDECVARIESACAEAEQRTGVLEHSPAIAANVNAPQIIDAVIAQPTFSPLNSTGTAAQVAKQAGMTTGEVELLRGLESISTR